MRAHMDLRERVCEVGRSLFARHFAHGSSGNISVRCEEAFLVTPTQSCLGTLDPADLALLSSEGRHLSGARPSKEWHFHQACYDARNSIGAVIHLHSTYAAAVSCLAGLNHENCLPPLTAYQVMKFECVPLVPFFRPGDSKIGFAVGQIVRRHSALLLANHGPVVVGSTLEAALHLAEELEETAKLFLLLKTQEFRPLSASEIADVRAHFPQSPIETP